MSTPDDSSTMNFFNCNIYGHYVVKRGKPRLENEKSKELESNLNQFEDDEPTLLLTRCDQNGGDIISLNKEGGSKFCPEGRHGVTQKYMKFG